MPRKGHKPFNHSKHLAACLTRLGLEHLMPRKRGPTKDLVMITAEQLKALVREYLKPVPRQ